MTRLNYPNSRRDDVVDVLHGVPVADPYRWLEDANSTETKNWVEDQNTLTHSVLNTIPGRDRILDRLLSVCNYERRSQPFRAGKRWFFYRNSGLQNQSVLYVAGKPDAKRPRVLLDPNRLSEDGTLSLADTSFSWDGKLMAYGVSNAGSDWTEWRVKDVASGQDLPDVIRWVKFSSMVWDKDGTGFYYGRYAEPNPDNVLDDINSAQKIYYHKLGQSQDADKLIYERPDHPEWSFSAYVGWKGLRLYIYVYAGASGGNRLFYKDLGQPESPVIELFADNESKRYIAHERAHELLLYTTQGAPLGRLVKFDFRTYKGGTPKLKEVIPQSDAPLTWVSQINNRLVAIYKRDVLTEYELFGKDGKSYGKIAMPGVGTASGIGGHHSRSKKAFYTFESYTQPASVYEYDLETGKSTLFRRPNISLNHDEYVTEQVFYPSKDGTRIPMFISYKKGLQKNGTNPTLLYGYGGFDISLEPYFSTSRLIWLEMGGIYAVANLRGGGEYGEAWHKAGTKLQKQNVFDDFIAGAEWLINSGYTNKEKLAINGGSNGGLLVGACLTQRPDLFAAAIPEVGVLDMLRFHKFTIGQGWTGDYGCADNKDEFQALLAYSPVHNVRTGVNYPATLIMTGDHDDRVVPAHSYKFAATLQAKQEGGNPVLIRIETDAGHGAGKPLRKQLQETADKYAFLARYLNFSYQPGS